MKHLPVLIALVSLFSLLSCGTSKKVTEEVFADSLQQTSNAAVVVETTTETKTEGEDSSEEVTVTITTEYDTSKADEAGNSPVMRRTESYTRKRKGSKESQDTKTQQNISATKEESANQVTSGTNKRESAKVETKQPLYYSYLLYGVALVILMAILAYWVFTKYRATKPRKAAE